MRGGVFYSLYEACKAEQDKALPCECGMLSAKYGISTEIYSRYAPRASLGRYDKVGKTAEMGAVQGVVGTAQGAYLGYATKPHGAKTRKCEVYTSFYSCEDASRASLSAIANACTMLSMSPVIKASKLYWLKPIRWSVTRLCGKL